MTPETIPWRNVAEDDRRTMRIGGVPVGTVVARETLENGRIVYEIEPFPMWAGKGAHPREEIQ